MGECFYVAILALRPLVMVNAWSSGLNMGCHVIYLGAMIVRVPGVVRGWPVSNSTVIPKSIYSPVLFRGHCD